VSDGSLRATNSFLITVKAVDTPPGIPTLTDENAEQKEPIGPIALRGTEEEKKAGNGAFVSASPTPIPLPASSLEVRGTNADRSLIIDPVPTQPGEAKLEPLASLEGLKATNTFLLQVRSKNTPPTISRIKDQTVDQDKSIEFTFSVKDKETAPEKLRVTKRSSNPSLIPESNIDVGVRGTSDRVRITPVSGQSGESRIRLTVSDGKAETNTDFMVRVKPANAPPIISRIEDQITEQDKPIELAFSVSDKETPSRRLSITKSSSNPLLVPDENIVLSGSGEHRALRVTPADKQTGTAEITVCVNDGLTPVRTSFQLEVTPRRQPAAVSTMTNSIGMEFVKVGPYWIAKYEVTALEYEQLSPLDSPGLRGKHEPAHVTWNDAMTFCGQLTFAEQEAKSPLGKGWIYTLLTTNEWRAIMGEETFASLGEKMSDHLDLKRIDPTYKVRFDDGLQLELTSDIGKMQTQLEKVEKTAFTDSSDNSVAIHDRNMFNIVFLHEFNRF
jgi:hypothetical protein